MVVFKYKYEQNDDVLLGVTIEVDYSKLDEIKESIENIYKSNGERLIYLVLINFINKIKNCEIVEESYDTIHMSNISFDKITDASIIKDLCDFKEYNKNNYLNEAKLKNIKEKLRYISKNDNALSYIKDDKFLISYITLEEGKLIQPFVEELIKSIKFRETGFWIKYSDRLKRGNDSKEYFSAVNNNNYINKLGLEILPYQEDKIHKKT